MSDSQTQSGDLPVYHHDYHPHPDDRPKVSFWRKLGAGSLSISLIIHGVFLAIAVVWIFQIIPEKKPDIDFMPSGGGGGSVGAETKVKSKQRMVMTSTAPRVAAKDVVSGFTLPEPEAGAVMSSLGALAGGGLTGGLGGSGSGGGRGTGAGPGFGSGSGLGTGMAGGGGKLNPFGMIDPNANALVGTFYDTKQTERRKPTGMTPEALRELIKDFLKDGWKEKSLDKFYRPPQQLYQTRIYIPKMPADAAPAAFNCEKEVQPSRWLIVYRGNVTPPESGKYRFVGAADDVLAIRFNGQPVFDYGHTLGSVGITVSPSDVPALRGDADNRDLKKKIESLSPMKLPLTYYRYPSTGAYNGHIGGLAAGPEFEAKAGASYPIEILISEIPGGAFGACLLIEKSGERYRKDKSGTPTLPLFRLDDSLPDEPTEGVAAPPFDPKGPVWRIVSTRGKMNI